MRLLWRSSKTSFGVRRVEKLLLRLRFLHKLEDAFQAAAVRLPRRVGTNDFFNRYFAVWALRINDVHATLSFRVVLVIHL